MINLDKPLFQATIGDLKEVLTMALNDIELESEGKTKAVPKRYVYGIAGIAKLFGCSEPTAQRIKSSGDINHFYPFCFSLRYFLSFLRALARIERT